MTLKEVIKNQQKGVIYEFFWIDMQKIQENHLSMLYDYPVVPVDDLYHKHYKAYKVLVCKKAQLHAKNIRKVKNCFECLRYAWCEDLTSELRKEHQKDLENKK